MSEIIEKEFATRNDPHQLQVNDDQLQKLRQLHSFTLVEKSNEDGPLIWILIIPTSLLVMNEFIDGKITETELLEKTNPGGTYECIYLCSATTLPEARKKGETKKLCAEAVHQIKKDHPIQALYVWPFSEAGSCLAEAVASECSLPLFFRKGLK